MANIKGILKINDVGNGVIESYTTSIQTNNLSKVPQSTNILSFVENLTSENKNYGGAIGTPIGITKISDMRFGVLDSNNVRSEQYKGVDFGYTNANGVFNLTITIVGTDIINFKIYFDKLRGQYPTDYTWYDIDNNAHVVTGNTSDEISFTQRAGYGTTIIVFSQWALPNTMIGITFIENIEIDMYLDKQWIISYETQSQKTNDASELIYGPLANTGKILLKDINDKLYENAKMGYLNVNLFSLELYLNNKLFQYHISTDSPYYSSNNTLQLQLSNDIYKWNDITVPEMSFSNPQSMYDVLDYILDQYEENYINNVVFDTLYFVKDVSSVPTNDRYIISTHLQNIKVAQDRPFTLKEDTLINQLKKFCTTMSLNCYMDDNNKLHFSSSRPILDYIDENDYLLNGIIDIPYNKQINKLEYDMLVSNRFDDVEIS